MSVCSDGSYGVPEGLISSFPVTVKDGTWEIVQGLEIDDFSRGKIDASVAELAETEPVVIASSIDYLDDALDLAMNAARTVTRGYQPVGSRTAVTNGSVILVQQQYQFTWPYQKPGSLWAISRESTICLVDFSGEKITSDQISTLGQWIELR